MTSRLWRCEFEGTLLLDKHIKDGVCMGHRIRLAYHGGLMDWLKVRWWKLTGQL